MMAMLWAQQIMMQETEKEAKELYARVPRLLKEKVKKILVDSGMGEDFMMAMLWAQQIMMQETEKEAKELYARVPRLLKEKVKKILVDSGMGHLTE